MAWAVSTAYRSSRNERYPQNQSREQQHALVQSLLWRRSCCDTDPPTAHPSG